MSRPDDPREEAAEEAVRIAEEAAAYKRHLDEEYQRHLDDEVQREADREYDAAFEREPDYDE